jgi:DNA methylase
MRSVLSLASEPCHFAHFATMPTELVRRCLRAGAPAQVCRACGKPHIRQVETVGSQRMRWAPGVDQYHTQAKGPHGSTSSFTTGDVAVRRTTGFSPSCACSAPTRPSTVLDPFCGSGTTLLVARELGLDAVGLDLSYPYLHDIARERLGLAEMERWLHGFAAPRTEMYTDLPLFAGEGASAQGSAEETHQ